MNEQIRDIKWNKIKYALYAKDFILVTTVGRHICTEDDLIRFYRVNKKECMKGSFLKPTKRKDLIRLYPRCNGDYDTMWYGSEDQSQYRQ
jgi:hypothetical protein